MNANVQELGSSIVCNGISIRTTNQAESNPKSAKIGKMWQTFYEDYFDKLPEGSQLYGIYHNYESDANGAFDVIAGFKQSVGLSIENSDLVKVTIPKGKYLVFSEQGTLPDAVITAWQNIWAYFNDDTCAHTRLYNVDFEHYVSESQVDFYIGIK